MGVIVTSPAHLTLLQAAVVRALRASPQFESVEGLWYTSRIQKKIHHSCYWKGVRKWNHPQSHPPSPQE